MRCVVLCCAAMYPSVPSDAWLSADVAVAKNALPHLFHSMNRRERTDCLFRFLRCAFVPFLVSWHRTCRPRASSLLRRTGAGTGGFPGWEAHCNFLARQHPGWGAQARQPTWKRNTTAQRVETQHPAHNQALQTASPEAAGFPQPGGRETASRGTATCRRRTLQPELAAPSDPTGLAWLDARRLPPRAPKRWTAGTPCLGAADCCENLPEKRTLTLNCPRPTLTDPDLTTRTRARIHYPTPKGPNPINPIEFINY